MRFYCPRFSTALLSLIAVFWTARSPAEAGAPSVAGSDPTPLIYENSQRYGLEKELNGGGGVLSSRCPISEL